MKGLDDGRWESSSSGPKGGYLYLLAESLLDPAGRLGKIRKSLIVQGKR